MEDTIPKRSGATVQWFRYGTLSSNTTSRTTAGGPGTATEGQIGAGTTLTSAVVTATVAQYTDYIALSDFARDVHIDDTLAAASRNLGYRAGLSVDVITRTEIDTAAGTAILTTLGSVFSAKDAAAAFFGLQAVDVSPMDSGKAKGFMYGVMHPFVAYDFLNDPAVGGILDMYKYSQPGKFESYEDRGYLATIHGVKFYASTNVKITSGSPNTYRTYVFGQEGVGMVGLAGKEPTRTTDTKVRPFKINVVEGGKPDKADPEGIIGGDCVLQLQLCDEVASDEPVSASVLRRSFDHWLGFSSPGGAVTFRPSFFSEVAMNPNQLATIDEAKAIAAKLSFMGGGVKDIYVPEYMGPYSAPENGAAKFFHFKFANGADGFNVGLIRVTMQMFPTRWPAMLSPKSTRLNRPGIWTSFSPFRRLFRPGLEYRLWALFFLRL
jgi:N4-gp56 family major capsid protein